PADSTYTTLFPRQQVTSTPQAIRSLTAANADTATNATQLGGVAANQYVVTTDTRLSDARNPSPGSPNYIQNATSPQPGASFNVGGDGNAGGTLSGNIVNAATQYNIGGSRVLSVSGGTGFLANSNTFAGMGAGAVTTPNPTLFDGNLN